MKETNFLSATDMNYGETSLPDNVSVNVPTGTSPDYISMILSSLPSIFGFFQKPAPQPVQQTSILENPYVLLGGAALLIFIAKQK